MLTKVENYKKKVGKKTMSIWLIAAIGGFLATQFVNPVLIYRFFEESVLCIKKRVKGTKRKFDVGINKPLKFLSQQVLCGGFTFIFLILWQIIALPDRTILQILSTVWISGVVHVIYAFYLEVCYRSPFKRIWRNHSYGFETCIEWSAGILGAILILISLGLELHKPVYNFTNPKETTITIMEEEKVPTLNVDLAETIEKVTALQGYSYRTPIKRGDKIIIPMDRDNSASIVGYAVIENDELKFVEKELKYTPYQVNEREVTWVARKVLPDKIFFSSWSFQLSDTGDVYFVRVYGDYACLRAGRNIEGIVAVNASTGEITTYSLDEIPSWVDGISE